MIIFQDTRADEGDRRIDSKSKSGDAEVASESNPYTVFMLMESAHDKLKLLNYDNDFCSKRGYKSFSKHYFAVADNANEQLFVFGGLMSWLLSIVGHRFTAPEQYDDPNQVTTNIMLELRKQGISTEFSQSKLKHGFGEELCQVLNTLTQMALKAKKWKWVRPEHGREEFTEEAPHHEDAEVVAEREVEPDQIEEDVLDDDDDMPVGSMVVATIEKLDKEVLNSKSEAELQAWTAEVERVLPLLKVCLLLNFPSASYFLNFVLCRYTSGLMSKTGVSTSQK